MTIVVWIYYVILALLAVYGAHRLYLVALSWRLAKQLSAAEPPPLPHEYPIVTVQLPLYNERLVAVRLIDAVAALDWPRDRLQIQVLDDSTDDTTQLCRAKVKELCEQGFDAVHLHRTDRRGFKAGALQAGLKRARGDIVLILDADFLPPPKLLLSAVGHFTDADIGMVQLRWEHVNRDYSMLTRVQALILDGHFVIEQCVRAKTGRFFNFNGTAGLWRRSAIEDAGGWSADTLTEDLDLSYRALLLGWRFVYLVGVAAPAELPIEMNAFKSQQFRWAKGSIQVARKLLGPVMRAKLPAHVKIEAWFHLTQNVPYLLTFALALVAVPALALSEHGDRPALGLLEWPLLCGTVATLLCYCVWSQRSLPQRESSWLVALRVPVVIAITAGICINQSRAVVEGLIGLKSPFVRTPKTGVIGGASRPPRRYQSNIGLVPIAEGAMALYFAAAVALSLEMGRWAVVPVLLTFALGFGYVAVTSIARR